jgi:hypothetical protein
LAFESAAFLASAMPLALSDSALFSSADATFCFGSNFSVTKVSSFLVFSLEQLSRRRVVHKKKKILLISLSDLF